jgi:hypothetical protein
MGSLRADAQELRKNKQGMIQNGAEDNVGCNGHCSSFVFRGRVVPLFD